MAKIMSVLEKYKFIEKEDSSTSEKTTTSFPTAPEAKPETTPSTTIEPTQEIVMEPTLKKDLPYPTSDKQQLNYNNELSLEQIYTYYALDVADVTRTVFVLENLMNALPNELPEYVKKTTLQNIIVASAMNLDTLLKDGMDRSAILSNFSSHYTSTTETAICDLKNEIAQLTAVMNDYQQQIKNKELLLQQQMQLIKNEDKRLQDILTFFKE